LGVGGSNPPCRTPDSGKETKMEKKTRSHLVHGQSPGERGKESKKKPPMENKSTIRRDFRNSKKTKEEERDKVPFDRSSCLCPRDGWRGVAAKEKQTGQRRQTAAT